MAVAVQRGADGVVTRCALAVGGTVLQAQRLAPAEAALTGSVLDGDAIDRVVAVAGEGVAWAPAAESALYRSHRLGVLLARLLRTLA